jgi:putative tryptophan/tyrosine transport system substrate-binding protein
MRRREVIALAGTALVAWPLVARAQQRTKSARIGFLYFGTPPANRLEALRAGLRDLGYVEGKNLVFESATVLTPTGRDGAFATMAHDRVGAVLVHASTQTARNNPRPLAELALKHRFPTMFGVMDNVGAG